MEIKTIDEAKAVLDKSVKCYFPDNEELSENLKALPVIQGTLVKAVTITEHTKAGDKVTSITYLVDVIDPKDGGIHHLKPENIFTDDSKDVDVKNVEIDSEIAVLQKKIVDLQSAKTKEG